MESIIARIINAIGKAAAEQSETVKIPTEDAVKMAFVLEKMMELDKEINRQSSIYAGSSYAVHPS